MYQTANQQQLRKVLDLHLGDLPGWISEVRYRTREYTSVETVASVVADELGFVFSVLNKRLVEMAVNLGTNLSRQIQKRNVGHPALVRRYYTSSDRA